jgi:lipooligosaccharide transport system permease protein
VLFGVAHSPWIAILPIVAVLTAVSIAAPCAAFASTMENDAGFAIVFRLGVMPLFLFSGTFYPVDQLPDALATVIRFVPLWHGVELGRAASLGTLELLPALGHLAYLLVWIVAGVAVALRTFDRRLLS